jgi:hypothetical protein
MSPRRFLLLALIVMLAGCSDRVTGPNRTGLDPARAISDAVHDAQGNPHFFWLPPLADQPPARMLRRFEALASPRLDLVCLETNAGTPCDPAVPIRTFTLGHGLVVEADHFKVELDTHELGLSISSDDGRTYTTYRLVVRTDPLADFGGPFALGHADFQVAQGGKGARSRTTNEMFGLVDGRTLPVRFRVDGGAYAHALKTNGAEATGDPEGEPLCQQHCSVTLIDPEETTLATLDDGTGQPVTAIRFQPGDLDQASVLVIDQRITDGEDANCADGVLVDKKYCYRYRITPDVPFNNDVRFGICPREIFDRADAELWRLMKVDYDGDDPVLTYPAEVDVRDFLPCSAETQASLLSRVLQYASKRIIRPLFAQTGTRTWGGTIRDLSDLFWGKQPPGPGAITGSVTLDGLEPAVGAVVTLIGTGVTATTNAAGTFSMSAVPAGNHTLAASTMGYRIAFMPVVVAAEETASASLDLPSLLETAAVGAEHACRLSTAGTAYCWGKNFNGELGKNSTGQDSLPMQVHGGHVFRGISVGTHSTCGWTATGAGYCWGWNHYGVLGTGDTDRRLAPAPIAGGLTFAQISVADWHACGLTPEGTAYCWGRNFGGSLGTGVADSSFTPVPVAGSHTFTSITAGLHWTCALTPEGLAYCWGHGMWGSLGTGDQSNRLAPAPVSGGLRFSTLKAGLSTTCGVDRFGVTYCWGSNYWGTLGLGSTAGGNQLTPAAITGGLGLVTAGASSAHRVFAVACGHSADGTAYCWGPNGFGSLGTTVAMGSCQAQPIPGYTTEPFPCTGTPTAVEGGLRFKAIYPGGTFACGITLADVMYCWGSDNLGQLGSGRVAPSACAPEGMMAPCSFAPIRVEGLP